MREGYWQIKVLSTPNKKEIVPPVGGTISKPFLILANAVGAPRRRLTGAAGLSLAGTTRVAPLPPSIALVLATLRAAVARFDGLAALQDHLLRITSAQNDQTGFLPFRFHRHLIWLQRQCLQLCKY